MLAGRTFDPRFVADATHPLIRACRRVPRFARRPAFEALRVDVVAAAKQRLEQSDLCFRRRMMVDASNLAIHRCRSRPFQEGRK